MLTRRVVGLVIAATTIGLGGSVTPASAADAVNGTAIGSGTTSWTSLDPAGHWRYSYDIAGSFADRTHAVAGTFHLTITGDESVGSSEALLTVVDRRGTSSYSGDAMFPGLTGTDPSCWTFSGQFWGCLDLTDQAPGELPGLNGASYTDPVTATGSLGFSQ